MTAQLELHLGEPDVTDPFWWALRTVTLPDGRTGYVWGACARYVEVVVKDSEPWEHVRVPAGRVHLLTEVTS